jgi:PAS domain S-box-containing protein
LSEIMKTHLVKVLLVDANAREAAELQQKITDSKNTSFSVQTVGGLSEAFDRLRSQKFEIVLADLGVPDSHGIASLQELQSKASETPIVVVSSVFQESEALETVRAGAQDYLVKSRLNPPALERILLYCIERHRGRKRTAMQYSVSRVLAESESLREAAAGLLRVLCDFLNCDFGRIFHLDRWSGELVHYESYHIPSREFPLTEALSKEMRFTKGMGLPGRAWASFAPVCVRDLTQDPTSTWSEATREGLLSAFAFPITLGAENLGVIEFLSPDLQEPDDELLKVVTNIGTQVGQFMARKLAEEEKEHLTNERLLILDSASEGIYGVDFNGFITFMNRSAAKMFRCLPADVNGKSDHQLFHHSRPDGSCYAAEDCPIYRVLSTGQGCRVDDEYFWRTDGTRFTVDYSSFPVLEAGTIKGAVVCFNDITDRKGMEVELRHAQKLEAVGSLAAGIAHEINTPIQFVGDNTRFLQDAFRDSLELFEKFEEVCREAQTGAVKADLLKEVRTVREKIDWDYLRREIPRALDQMVDGIGRVAAIVRAMKEFSHVDRSSEKTPADLNKALESTLVVARNELKYVADVEVDYGELPLVVCHLGDLNQVFLNLLINAAHAIGDVVKGTEKRGKIGVRTRQEAEWVEIAVADTGTGIPDSVAGNVFDPFFTTKQVGKGTGQGLTLARAIVVEKHGGTLTFETAMGKGTTFFVRLPVIGTPEPQEAVAK